MGTSTNIIFGAAAVSVDGVDVGYTQGGVMLSKEIDVLDTEADQNIGIVVKNIMMEKMFLATTMLEGTLANILIALSEPASNTAGSGDLEYGDEAPSLTEHILTIVGKAPSSGTRTYVFYRAVLAEAGEFPIGSREAVLTLPVRFELLKDSDHDNKFGYHTDS